MESSRSQAPINRSLTVAALIGVAATSIRAATVRERFIDKPQLNRNGQNHHSAYAVPSKLILSEPLCTSKMPGSDWEILWLASSITMRQLWLLRSEEHTS